MLRGSRRWIIDDYAEGWDLEGGEVRSREIDKAVENLTSSSDTIAEIIDLQGDIEDSQKELNGEFEVVAHSGATDLVLSFWLSSVGLVGSSSAACIFDTESTWFDYVYEYIDEIREIAAEEWPHAGQGETGFPAEAARELHCLAGKCEYEDEFKMLDIRALLLHIAFRCRYSAAEAGDIMAQIELAEMYVDGTAIEQSEAEALKWYLKAAEQGEALAQANVGLMYERGEGVEKNYAEALKWHVKAAEQGFPEAQDRADSIRKILGKEGIDESLE